MSIELINDFHNSAVRLRVRGIPCELSAGQVRRAKRTLCGVGGCLCSGILGTRGIQWVDAGDDYRRIVTTDAMDRQGHECVRVEWQD